MACLRRDNRVIVKRTSDQVKLKQNENTEEVREDYKTFIGKQFLKLSSPGPSQPLFLEVNLIEWLPYERKLGVKMHSERQKKN